MPKKDLNKLVNALIASFPKPQVLTTNYDAVAVFWYSKDPDTHSVYLEACEHRILLDASVDDGGPCPPTLECTYSHMRLKLMLQWMENHGTVDELYGMLHNGAFHQKYPLTDPPITKHIFAGRISEFVWHDLYELQCHL